MPYLKEKKHKKNQAEHGLINSSENFIPIASMQKKTDSPNSNRINRLAQTLKIELARNHGLPTGAATVIVNQIQRLKKIDLINEQNK